MHPYYHPLFVQFLVYFNTNHDYFEGHEVLEEYWKSFRGFSKSHPLTAYILLTTGMYHWRRENFSGALRTLGSAEKRFHSFLNSYPDYTKEIHMPQLLKDIRHVHTLVQSKELFQPFQIEIHSNKLQVKYEEATKHMTLLPKDSDEVIHKHMLRDRSDILNLRNEKKSGR